MKKLVPALTGLLLSGTLLAFTAVSLVGCGNNETERNSQSEFNSGKNSELESSADTESETATEVETNTESETTTETETSTEGGNGESQIPGGDTYTYIDLDKTMWASDVLNVRGEPSAEGERVGQLSYAQEVKVTGQCNETSWYRIEYNNGKVGYVSNAYLVDEKPAETGSENPSGSNEPNLTVDLTKDVTGKSVKKVGTIYVIGNAAYEAYGYNDDRGASYAELITKVADSLNGVSNVYCMPIPLGSGVMLPEEYKNDVSIGNQGAAIDSVLGHMGDNVIGVDIFETLREHNEEYLYFRTDHHWTQLGAYYAYTKFCEAKGISNHSLDYYGHAAYSGFVGSFYFSYSDNYKSTVNALYNAPDIVYTYHPVSNAKMTVNASDGSTYTWPIIKDVTNYNTGVKYSCFIAGDNPFTVIENKDITDGSVCVIVKESYGNAFVPYLVDHYQTVYVIDQRYWSGNVIDFAKSKNATDVIFANNLTAIGSKSQIANFRKIIE